MDIFDKFAEMVVKFVRKYVVKFVVNKLLDWIWKKIKPKLLKAARKLCQILKDRLQKVKKKWLELRQKKRANVHNILAREPMTLVIGVNGVYKIFIDTL